MEIFVVEHEATTCMTESQCL